MLSSENDQAMSCQLCRAKLAYALAHLPRNIEHQPRRSKLSPGCAPRDLVDLLRGVLLGPTADMSGNAVVELWGW